MSHKDTSIFEDIIHIYAQQNPPQEDGGQANPQDENGADTEQTNPGVDTDSLAQGQTIYDLAGIAYTVLEPTQDGQKQIMPSDQQGQQVPKGIKQVEDNDLASSYTMSPQASRKMAQSFGNACSTASDSIEDAVRELQPFANSTSSELDTLFANGYIDPLNELAGFLKLERMVSERGARVAQDSVSMNWNDFDDILSDMHEAIGKKDAKKLMEAAEDMVDMILMNVSVPEDTKISKVVPKEKVAEILPAFRVAQERSRGRSNTEKSLSTGRYTFGKDQRLCECGHPLVVHIAEDPHDCQVQDFAPTAGFCGCEEFRPTKDFVSDEDYAVIYGRGEGDYSWGEETTKESNILMPFRKSGGFSGVVYRGTSEGERANFHLDEQRGIYFTTDTKYATDYGPVVYKCKVALTNPIEFSEDEANTIMTLDRGELISEGYDGRVINYKDGSKDVIAFYPEQVEILERVNPEKESNILLPFRKAQMGDVMSFHEPQTFSSTKDNEDGLVIGENGFGECMARLKEMVGKYEVVDVLLTLGEEFPRELANKVLSEAREKGIL
jgi:hypothetical protein